MSLSENFSKKIIVASVTAALFGFSSAAMAADGSALKSVYVLKLT